jgi:hypothetical protein
MNEKIEMIRQLAYYIWEREGRPSDSDQAQIGEAVD